MLLSAYSNFLAFKHRVRSDVRFYIQQTTKNIVDASYDAIGILLCIRINMQLALELQRRRVPTLENYTNATNMLLWPRFQNIMDLHVESVKKMQHSRNIIAAVKDVHPHYVTRRYAEF